MDPDCFLYQIQADPAALPGAVFCAPVRLCQTPLPSSEHAGPPVAFLVASEHLPVPSKPALQPFQPSQYLALPHHSRSFLCLVGFAGDEGAMPSSALTAEDALVEWSISLPGTSGKAALFAGVPFEP